MTALRLLQGRQEAAMSRVEPKERPVKREAQESRRQPGERVDRAPAKAAGDERPVAQALQNQDRRS